MRQIVKRSADDATGNGLLRCLLIKPNLILSGLGNIGLFFLVDGNSSQQSHKGANHGQALQRQKASEEVLKSRESLFFSVKSLG